MFGEIYSKCITFSYNFIYKQIHVHVNKVQSGLYIYQLDLCIGCLNLTMNTLLEYTRYFITDLSILYAIW